MPKKVKRKVDMLAEFGQLPNASRRRLLELARSTTDESVGANEHFDLVVKCELEARHTMSSADVDQEFAFCRKWLSVPGNPERLLRNASN